jgi:hypothetical protein
MRAYTALYVLRHTINGLRDYGIEPQVWGGEPSCTHVWGGEGKNGQRQRNGAEGGLHDGRPTDKLADNVTLHPSTGSFCRLCGCWRGSLGLEPTLSLYLDHMVEVCREVRRVMRHDATFWLNIGDSYAGSGKGGNPDAGKQATNRGSQTIGVLYGKVGETAKQAAVTNVTRDAVGFKAKDLMMVPARLAIRLQEPYHFGPIKREIDRAWLAGIVDADGCIGIRRGDNGKWNPSYIPYLSVGCSDLAILDRCAEITGLGKVNLKSHAGDTDPRGIKQRRDGYLWRLDGQIASKVIRDILPYLVQKGIQARVCDAMNQSQAEHRPARNKPVEKDIVAYRQALYEGIKSLNQRESVDLPKIPEPLTNIEPGWYLRSDIIWAKASAMPESVTDRPTSAHEHVFLLSKAARYFYDSEAIKEEAKSDHASGNGYARSEQLSRGGRGQSDQWSDVGGKRNMRNFMLLGPEPFPLAHFAVYPTAIPRIAILAGTSERGVCPKCAAPYARVVDKRFTRQADVSEARGVRGAFEQKPMDGSNSWEGFPRGSTETQTIGWRATCRCDAGEPVPATVLDPFAGAFTTCLVSERLQRNSIGIELNPTYCEMGRKRLAEDASLFFAETPAESRSEDESPRQAMLL